MLCLLCVHAAGDYREWWYRLQSVRYHVQRVLPALCENTQDVNKQHKKFTRDRQNALFRVRRSACLSCFKQEGELFLISIGSFLVYGLMLSVAFPIMLALNLDQLAQTTTNTTRYDSFANPNPNQILRTTCWPRSTPPRGPWAAVFCPFILTTVYALAINAARSLSFIQ